MGDLKLYSKTEKTLDSLIQTVCIFSNDIKMEFGIETCAILVLKGGKVVKSEGIRTNVIKAKIDKTQEESKCRMCH